VKIQTGFFMVESPSNFLTNST